MADHQTDYSGLGMAAGALKGFSEAMESGEDRKMKKMELDAHLKAQEDQRTRQALIDKLSLQKEGYTQGADGSLQEAALTPRQKAANQLKEFSEGAKASGYDEQGNPTGYEYNPNSTRAHEAEAKAAAARASAGDRTSNQADTKDRREHERTLNRIAGNPQVKQRLTQFQNLDNALSQIASTDHLTPQQIHEAQQAIRGNLGIKGNSGIGEREDTYIKSLGLNAEAFKQFLTGEPADISADNALVKHIINMAQIEQKNIRKQFETSLRAASGGHASMYGRRQDLKEDLDDYLTGLSGQMETQVALPESAPSEGLIGRQQGLLKEQPGLLRRGYESVKGMLGGGAQPATAGAQSSGPKVGQVEDGHEFLGGDPGDPKAWKKIDTKDARK